MPDVRVRRLPALLPAALLALLTGCETLESAGSWVSNTWESVTGPSSTPASTGPARTRTPTPPPVPSNPVPPNPATPGSQVWPPQSVPQSAPPPTYAAPPFPTTTAPISPIPQPFGGGPKVIDVLLIDIPGGEFLKGDPLGASDEPSHWTRVAPFRIMRAEVTNREFGAFVETTGRITDAERLRAGYVFSEGRWTLIAGASWRQPQGPGSNLLGLADHPVVQVSQGDAEAFCRWAGLRLPREQEWEYAARGADGRRFPWGNQAPIVFGEPIRANLGQSTCCAPSTVDGYLRTWPTGVFTAGASPFGILDLAGNVWEWTATPFEGRPGRVVMRGGGWASDPDGIRTTIRHGNPPDIGLDMVGFRCAGDTPGQGGRTEIR